MASPALKASRVTGDPAWEIVDLFPPQGQWSEGEYLRLTDSTRRLVELVDGHVEVLPMPKLSHQRILRYLFLRFESFVGEHDVGEVVFSAFRLRIRPGLFREPDLLFRFHDSVTAPGTDDRYWESADLTLEVVSEDDPKRDLVEKRSDYAELGIKEYWIVDPRTVTITVLKLVGGAYAVHGEFGRGQQAVSALLAGLSVSVDQAFDAADQSRTSK